MLGKRSYRNYSYGPTGRTYKRRGINLTRPPTYRRNQGWQDWRAMKYIARKPLNLRTGGFLGKERKFVDYSAGGYVLNTWNLNDPAAGALNAVAQGNGESQRIGRAISNASLHIDGTISLLTQAIGQEIKIIVVKDTQTNGAPLTPGSVMIGNVNSFRNLEWLTRYQVLYSRVFTLNPSITLDAANNVIGNNPRRNFSINVKLTGSTTFDGTTADVSDITDCSYHLLACSTNSAAQGLRVDYLSRFRYYG